MSEQRPPMTSRAWCEAIAAGVYGNRAGVADLLEDLVMGDAETRKAAADQLMALDAEPVKRDASPLPDVGSPLYKGYRKLGRSVVFMACASELLVMARAFRDPELEAAIRKVHGRALEHLIATQRRIGFSK